MAQQCLFIAVVDDDAHFCAQMQTYLEQAAQSLALTISVECFTSPLDFVSDYSAKHDILFLDIEMPDVDGLSVARRIRQMDNSLCIIFVTSMAQYAIRGYEVSALDFVVKPVAYTTVANKLQKAALYCESRRDADVMLSRGNVAVRVRCSEIFYIEKEQNYLVYHTQSEEFRQRGTISAVESQFSSRGFGCCNRGCLVNFAHVQQTSRDTVWVGGTALPLSRTHRKGFMDGLMKYLGGGL